LDSTNSLPKIYFCYNLPHGFDRIPIVYDDYQDEPFGTPKSPIDNNEVVVKIKDMTIQDIQFVTEGEVLNMPLKEESGKHFNVPPIRW
jgi:hypothetical protein